MFKKPLEIFQKGFQKAMTILKTSCAWHCTRRIQIAKLNRLVLALWAELPSLIAKMGQNKTNVLL